MEKASTYFIIILALFSCGQNKAYNEKQNLETSKNNYNDGNFDIIYYFDLGKKCSHDGKYNDAIKNFSQAIKLNPQIAALYFNRGLAKIELKNFDEALTDIEFASKLSPSDLSIIDTKGMVEFQAGYNQKALKDFNYVIENDSNRGNSYLERGLLKVKMGLKKEACEDFYIAKRLNISDADYCINQNCLRN